MKKALDSNWEKKLNYLWYVPMYVLLDGLLHRKLGTSVLEKDDDDGE